MRCATFLQILAINIYLLLVMLFMFPSSVEHFLFSGHKQTMRNHSNLHVIETNFSLQHCSCWRHLKVKEVPMEFFSGDPLEQYQKTTCSLDALRRGSGQKVISFCFYGSVDSSMNRLKGFFKGIQANLDSMTTFYPDYVMRLYTDVLRPGSGSDVTEVLCRMACANHRLDLCDAQNLPGYPQKNVTKMFPMMWRFLPTLDPQVDIVLSRDLDARFSQREVAAVNEWQDKGEPLHVMRDNEAHRVPILGGTWATDLRKKHGRRIWKSIWQTMMKDQQTWFPRTAYSSDQFMLEKHAYPLLRNLSVQHDSFSCLKYPGETLGFPTQRENVTNNFIGAVNGVYDYMWEECPEECRRKKEWMYC